MKPAVTCLLILLLSSLLLAQTGTAAPQQPATDPSQSSVVTVEQVRALQQALAAQQKRMDQQQREIEALREQLTAQSTPHVADAVLRTADGASPAPVPAALGAPAPQEEPKKESPLSFRIGGMDFTPGGFLDFSTVFRTTNTGNSVASNFATFPFSNTVAGHLSEVRLTSQYSRLSLKATGTFGRNEITGYVEADFNGNDPGNVFVSTNSHTNRLRVYWVDLRRGKWEFLGGQAYSWLTPSRRELSPLPADVFVSLDVDPNHQVGLHFTRAAQFRVAYHPTEHWSLGVAMENPQQYVGSGLEVNFPSVFNAQLGGQFDSGATPGTPNLHPDIIPKIAYDTDVNGKHFHAEAAGLITTMKATVIPTVLGATFESETHTGAGVEAAINFELFKGFHLVANGFWSDAGGRYIDGLGPDVVAVPVPAPGASSCIPGSAGHCTISLSPVHAGSGIVGFEAQVTKNHLLAFYYGGAYFQRNAFPDPTSSTVLLTPIACSTGAPLQNKPCIGFGGTNEPGSTSANRAIQEATIDWYYTFWQNKNYGKLQFLTQWSYGVRSPWFIPAGAPKNAHLVMGWMNLRYTLP